MDLMCCESLQENRAYEDPTLLKEEVLKNLIKAEAKYSLSSVNTDVQTDITRPMIKIVAEWMKEVCEERKCQEEVFLLSINYMNRFLTLCCIRRNQLQLLGTTCMFIASKLREPNPLTAKLLISYTDNSITLEELTSWEQLVLSKLKWDISVVTPLDFLRHIMLRIPIGAVGISEAMVDAHAKTLIAYCACEHTFDRYPPIMIAAACVASALLGIEWVKKSGQTLDTLLQCIHSVTSVEPVCLLECLNQVERMVDDAMGILSQENRTSDSVISSSTTPRPKEFTPPLLVTDKNVEIETASTPTDVHDVEF